MFNLLLLADGSERISDSPFEFRKVVAHILVYMHILISDSDCYQGISWVQRGSDVLREVRLISNSPIEFREVAAHSWVLAPVVDRSYCDSTIGLALRRDYDFY